MNHYIQITNASHRRYKQYFTIKGMDNKYFSELILFLKRDFKKKPFNEIKEARQNIAYILDEDRFWTPNIKEASKDGNYYLYFLWFDNDSRNLKDLGEKESHYISCNPTPPEESRINKGSGNFKSTYSTRLGRFVDVG